jgi:hydroxymethylpyrimidine pyrophosphatase-like HAD family hydrolase
MFNLVGFGVSVSRSYPDVVQAADVVTDAHGKEGSLELLQALLERVRN